MPSRIIYCALSCASVLTNLRHDLLRQLNSVAIAAVPDESMEAVLISTVIEADAMLMAELGPSGEAQTRRQFANALAQQLKRYDQPEYAAALPYAEPERGVWISPVNPALKDYLKTRGMAGLEWR